MSSGNKVEGKLLEAMEGNSAFDMEDKSENKKKMAQLGRLGRK